MRTQSSLLLPARYKTALGWEADNPLSSCRRQLSFTSAPLEVNARAPLGSVGGSSILALFDLPLVPCAVC